MLFAFWLRIPALLRLFGLAQSAGHQLSPRPPARTPNHVPPRPLPERRPEPALRLEIEVLDGWKGPVVRLRGEAGVPEARALEASVVRLVARRSGCVTFDLSKLTFISSLAMGVLVAYHRGAVRSGARVCLALDLHPAVREALERTGLLGLFETDDGVQAGVGAAAVADESRTVPPNVNHVQCTDGVSWVQLVELEPQVLELLWRARLAGASCRNSLDVERVFGSVKHELAGLIGFAGKNHKHPVLGSVGAYQVAYGKLYDAVAGLVPHRAAGPQQAPEKQPTETGAEPCPTGSTAPATARV
jgi:anti-anti-sigma factor